MKRVLLTGGAGFVGANLARRLIQDGHEVHVLVRHSTIPWRIRGIHDAVRLHEVELADAESVRIVVSAVRPHWVFHLAAYGAYSAQTSVQAMVQSNIVGTINLMEACLTTGFEAFINTGSSSEYGYKDSAPIEDDWLDPNSHYAVTKAFGTQFCRFTAQRYQMPILTLRLYSVFGPYEEPTRLLPALILRGFEGALPPLVHPDTARDFIYIDDVMDAHLCAARQASSAPTGAVYNVGTGTQTTLLEVVDVARRLLDIQCEPTWDSMPNRPWDTRIWVANCQKIRDELGWQAQCTLEQGFGKMIEWFRSHPEMERVYRAGPSASGSST